MVITKHGSTLSFPSSLLDYIPSPPSLPHLPPSSYLHPTFSRPSPLHLFMPLSPPSLLPLPPSLPAHGTWAIVPPGGIISKLIAITKMGPDSSLRPVSLCHLLPLAFPSPSPPSLTTSLHPPMYTYLSLPPPMLPLSLTTLLPPSFYVYPSLPP